MHRTYTLIKKYLFSNLEIIKIPHIILLQFHNAERVVARGYGLKLNLMTFTAEDLAHAIKQLVDNSTYRKNIQHASKVMRSRPMNARQLGGYWVDHVIKYGSEHMRSSSYDMPLYQYLLLDVLAFLLLCLFFLIFIFTCCVYRLCFKTTPPRSKTVGNKKRRNVYKSE